MNLEDILQTTEIVGGFSHDLQPPENPDEHIVDKIWELNLEDNLQTTETVGSSQDLQPPENAQTEAHAHVWGIIMLGHMHQIRKQPIVLLDCQLGVYAMRLVKKVDAHDTISYSSKGYALLAKIGEKWFCHRCPNWENCLHILLLYKCWQGIVHLSDQLQVDGNMTTHIYKPQPSRRKLYINLPDWIEGRNHPTVMMTFMVTPSKSHNSRMNFKCSCGKSRCLHYEQFMQSRFNTHSDSPPENSEVQTPQPVSDDVLNPISTKPIFLPYDHDEYTTNRNIMDGFLHGKIPHLIPPFDQNAKCEHGNQFAYDRPKDDWLMIKGRKKHPPVLVTINVIRRVDVYYRPTIGSCDCKQFYDGKEDTILYVWDNFLLTHELMLNFETLLQYNSITINGYVQAWNANHKMYTDCYTISVNAFWYAYCAFVKLCKPREERMLFRCEICEQSPRQTLVCDGIQLRSAA